MRHPVGIKKTKSTSVSYSNRGMALESELNDSNTYYLVMDRAVIYKKPTPITINKVEYPSRIEAVIKEAYFRTPSTTDYNGLYKGRYIDFEAKETKSKSAFPLHNIHIHQLKHLENVIKHGGIAFILVRFTLLDQTYYLKAEDLLSFVQEGTRKSVPLSYFMEKGYLIKNTYNPRIDYLKIVDILYFGGLKNEKISV